MRLQTGVAVDFTADALPALGSDRIRELLSIAREALSNTARHAQARRAELTARQDAGLLRITVRDDGVGFDARQPLGEQHHGLGNMRRRAERLGGTLAIESQPGSGTRIMLIVPTERDELAGGGTGRA